MTAVPTTEWLEAAPDYDSQAEYSADLLLEYQFALGWLVARGEEARISADDFNDAYGTSITEEWLDWLHSPDTIADLTARLQDVDQRVAELPAGSARASPGSTRVSPAPAARVSPRVSPAPATSPPRGRGSAASSRSGSVSPSGTRRASIRTRSTSPVAPTRGARARREAAARAAAAAGPEVVAAVGAKRRRHRATSQPPLVKGDEAGQRTQKSLKALNISEAALWRFKVPGSDFEKDENKTNKENEEAHKEARTNDLVTLYKDPFSKGNTTKIPKVININSKIIRNLHKSIVEHSIAFTRYGPRITLQATVLEGGKKRTISSTAEDIKYMEAILKQRTQVTDFYVRALRTRRPKPKAGIREFKGKNTRLRLTPEAVAWVNAEDFTIPEDLAVVELGSDGVERSWTNLWEYIADHTGVEKANTWAAGKGYITKGNYQNLLRIPLVRIPAPPKPEKKKGEKEVKPTVKHRAKYNYTPAMMQAFLNTKATFAQGASKAAPRIANETNQSVISILTARQAPDTFSSEFLYNTGILPILTWTYYPAAQAVDHDPNFFEKDVYNADVHDSFIAESQAISDFYEAYKQNKYLQGKREAEVAKAEKKRRGVRRG